MAYAFDLDETVDDELRKNYANSKPISALEKNIQADDNGNEDLPELPKIIQQKPNLDKPVQKTVSKGKKVTLVGFGTFEPRKRAARNGRNPQTGKDIKIPAKTVPVFSAGKNFKTIVNGK